MDPDRHRQDGAAQRGLTAPETLVLAAVFVFLVAAVLLTYRRAEHPLDVAALRAGELVERARDLSVTLAQPHFVVFDVARHRVGLVDRHGAQLIDPLTRNAFLVEFSGTGRPGVQIESAEFGIAGSSVAFDVHGVPLAPGRIVLRHEEERLVLVLDPGAGALRVGASSRDDGVQRAGP